MSLDFPSAQLPRLTPLEGSFAENEVEADLKKLFLDLFGANLAGDSFDANVLGAAHLGSLDLVRKAVNTDGLVLLQGDREEAATRYLYRAWKSGDVQGRGLHFLRTYLQMLFPNECEVEQLWHDKESPYPTALYTTKPSFAWWLHQVGEDGVKLDGSWGLGRRIVGADESRANRKVNTAGMFLTSRILISLDFSVNTRSIASLIHIIRSVIPARLLPVFRFWLRIAFSVSVSMGYAMAMDKTIPIRYPWCGRVITEANDSRWKLGIDGEPARLPSQFGTFKLGKLEGGKVDWRLKSCRASGLADVEITGDALVWRVETIPVDPEPEYFIPDQPTTLFERVRRLDGTWTVGGAYQIGHFSLDGRRLRSRKMTVYPRFGEFRIHDHKPAVMLPPKPARLTLSGQWKLGGPRNPAFEFEIIKE
jgi:hypothetical protein